MWKKKKAHRPKSTGNESYEAFESSHCISNSSCVSSVHLNSKLMAPSIFHKYFNLKIRNVWFIAFEFKLIK